MLDKRKLMVIELSMEGYGPVDIAKKTNISRTTIWKWLKDKEIVDELDKRKHEIINQGERHTTGNLIHNIDYLQEQADDPETPAGIKANIRMYLIDRVVGKTTTKVETNDKKSTDQVPKDILEDEFNEVDSKDDE